MQTLLFAPAWGWSVLRSVSVATRTCPYAVSRCGPPDDAAGAVEAIESTRGRWTVRRATDLRHTAAFLAVHSGPQPYVPRSMEPCRMVNKKSRKPTNVPVCVVAVVVFRGLWTVRRAADTRPRPVRHAAAFITVRSGAIGCSTGGGPSNVPKQGLRGHFGLYPMTPISNTTEFPQARLSKYEKSPLMRA